MSAGISSTNFSTERPNVLMATVRSLPFIPSDFAPTASSAGTIVEMQPAVVNVKPRSEPLTQSAARQTLEVLA